MGGCSSRSVPPILSTPPSLEVGTAKGLGKVWPVFVQFGAFQRHVTQIYPFQLCHHGSQNFIYLTRGWAHPLDLAGVLPSPESLECRLYKILNMPLTVLLRDF